MNHAVRAKFKNSDGKVVVSKPSSFNAPAKIGKALMCWPALADHLLSIAASSKSHSPRMTEESTPVLACTCLLFLISDVAACQQAETAD